MCKYTQYTFLIFMLFPAWTSAQVAPQRIKSSTQVREFGFGLDITFHGDSLLIGTPSTDTPRNNAGAIEVYTQNQGEWQLDHRIQPVNPLEGDRFGSKFERIGNELFVLSNTGVYVLTYTNNEWAETQKLTMPDTLDFFVGLGMLATENHVFLQVTKSTRPTGQFSNGALLSFAKTDSNWTFEQLIHPQPGLGDEFGWYSCMSGETLMVGASRDPVIGDHSGSVFVYRKENSQWVQTQKLIPADAAFADQFGRGMTCFDDQVVVHAYSGGTTYSFVNNGNTFVEADSVVVPGNNRFLWNMESITGNLFILGNESQTSPDGNFQYISPIFRHDWQTDAWQLTQTISVASLVEPWMSDDGLFGYAMAMNNKYFAASAPFWDQMNADGTFLDEIGEVFVFPLNEIFVSTQSPTGSHKLPLNVSLYPNPATKFVTLQLNTPLSEPSVFHIFDVLGRQHITNKISAGTPRFTTTIEDLPTGLYGVQVCNARKGCTTATFIKQ